MSGNSIPNQVGKYKGKGRMKKRYYKVSKKFPRSPFGFNAVRFFKIRKVTTATATAGGVISYSSSIYDASGAQDWSSIVNLFDVYKVFGVKVQWIPANPFNTTASSLYVAQYVLADFDATSAPVSTIPTALQYENLKVKNAGYSWSVYYKAPIVSNPQISGAVTFLGGYFDTTSPPTNLGQVQIYSEVNTASQIYGQVIQTYYIGCKQRR